MNPPRAILTTCLAVVVAFVLAGSIGVVPAQAARRPGQPITCQSAQSSSDSGTAPILLGGCDQQRALGGSATVFTTGSGNLIVWSNGSVTKFNWGTEAFLPPTRCPAGTSFEIDAVGTIVSFRPWTGQWLGAKLAIDACLKQNLATVELVPGTVLTIG